MGSKSVCKSASHKQFKDKAKNRLDDLQGMFTDLQLARRESRTSDAVVLEVQVDQMLREWKAELNESSPASSLIGGGTGSFSSDIFRILQRVEEEDDATSALAPPLQPEPDGRTIQAGDKTAFQEDCFANQGPDDCGFQGIDPCNDDALGVHNTLIHNLEVATHPYQLFDLDQEFDPNLFIGPNGIGQYGEEDVPGSSGILTTSICPPPSAFLGPKCALWDCARPALGSGWYQDYCDIFHATLALNEGPPGMTPVLRPFGIGLKDGPLFAALAAKTQGKNVGIPECEGAATTKSPWKNTELFDLFVLEGETIREWLFFDKPRRAFESGNRKQRSLPDYNGRGWHESRKQVMKEYGGLKRSYYMDPQPLNNFEWHLYEYEINNCGACALYRLELKLVDGKKTPKGKVSTDSLADLQKRMGQLTAEFPVDNKQCVKHREEVNLKTDTGNAYSAPDQIAPTNETFGYGMNAPYCYKGRGKVKQKTDAGNAHSAPDLIAPTNETFGYGMNGPYSYLVENLSGHHGT